MSAKMRFLFLTFLVFFSCHLVISQAAEDLAMALIGSTVSTSSLPLKLTCDSRTSHHIQAGGITLNGVPISSTLQNTAENECTNQVANQVGGINGLELSCEIWFGNAFVLNSTDVLYAIYQCLEAKPYGEVVWQQATQPRYITLSAEQKESNKEIVLQCDRGPSTFIHVEAVYINNNTVDVTKFPDLDPSSLKEFCIGQKSQDLISASQGIIKCSIKNKRKYAGILSINYSCREPRLKLVTDKVRNYKDYVAVHEPTIRPPANMSKDNTCLNTRPCLFGGLCVLKPNAGYICQCSSGFTGKQCKSKQTNMTGTINVTSLMYMGKTINLADQTQVSELERTASRLRMRFEKSLNNELRKLKKQLQAVESGIENVEFLNLRIGSGLVIEFVIYLNPNSTIRANEIARKLNYILAGYLLGSGINAEIRPIVIKDLTNKGKKKEGLCWSSPCKHNSTCIEVGASYECSCTTGFQGINCEEDINECSSSPCKNSGVCEDKVGRFSCNCPIGYSRPFCELQKYTALACEGNSVILSCSKGGLINIQKAFYGRRSNDVCSLTRGARDMNCKGSDLHVVEMKCQGKKFCVLMASRRTFGDVCGGIPAYLEIEYACNLREDVKHCSSSPCKNNGRCVETSGKFACVCLPGYALPYCEKKLETAHACEDAQLRISCADDAIINVQSAVYGRMNNKICPVKKQQDSWSCAASTSLSMAQQICEGENSCRIKARNSVFGDPCKGVRKYLEIKYVCKKHTAK